MIDKTFRLLLSYYYWKNVDFDALFGKTLTHLDLDIFADSGAYSAMTQGTDINIKDYADWIKRWSHWFTAYSNLDIIMDAKQTWKNQKILEDMGLQPVPTFHVLEDWSWLEKYLESYNYVALGVAGMQLRTSAIMRWLIKCFYMANEDGKNVKYHGFGLTSWLVMQSFPWKSVDSSSWSAGLKFGVVPVFDSHLGKFHKVRLGKKIPGKVYQTIKTLGFDPIEFADRSKNTRARVAAISTISYRESESYLRKNNKDMLIYLAHVTIRDLTLAYNGIRTYLNDPVDKEIGI